MSNPDPGQHAPIGILCALPEERALLLDALTGMTDLSDDALTAHLGRLDEQPVVIAEAGVGKVAAAVSATLLLERHACTALMLSGVAGGLRDDLAIGDIVVARRVVDVDYGRSSDDGLVVYQPGSLPLPHVVPAPGYDLPVALLAVASERLGQLDSVVTFGTIRLWRCVPRLQQDPRPTGPDMVGLSHRDGRRRRLRCGHALRCALADRARPE